MTIALYKVDLLDICGRSVYDGKKSALVYANSAAEAVQIVAAARGHDIDAAWLAADANVVAVPTSYEGWVFSIHLVTHAITKSFTGLAAATIDDIGTGLATALNTSAIDHAAYTGATNSLRVAEGATDAMGDDTFTVTVTPPVGLFPTGYTFVSTSMYTSKVQGGLSSADLSVVLVDALPGGALFI